MLGGTAAKMTRSGCDAVDATECKRAVGGGEIHREVEKMEKPRRGYPQRRRRRRRQRPKKLRAKREELEGRIETLEDSYPLLQRRRRRRSTWRPLPLRRRRRS